MSSATFVPPVCIPGGLFTFTVGKIPRVLPKYDIRNAIIHPSLNLLPALNKEGTRQGKGGGAENRF